MLIDSFEFPIMALWCPMDIDLRYGVAGGRFIKRLQLKGLSFVCSRIDVDEPANDIHRRIVMRGLLLIIEVPGVGLESGSLSQEWMQCCCEASVMPVGGKERYFSHKDCVTEILDIHKDVI